MILGPSELTYMEDVDTSQGSHNQFTLLFSKATSFRSKNYDAEWPFSSRNLLLYVAVIYNHIEAVNVIHDAGASSEESLQAMTTLYTTTLCD